MNAIKKFVKKAKAIGLKNTLRLGIDKFTGVKKCREEIDALYYYLNNLADITKFPKAEGALRKMQLCDAVLLSIFDAVCEREGWNYWITWGTLLGAKRHGGFIPWDDDQDICMMRKDYEDAMKRLPGIFASYGEDSLDCYIYHSGRIGIGLGYKHSKTGIWCDIFPCDDINAPSDDEATLNAIRERVEKYKKFYRTKGFKLPREELAKVRDELVICTKGGGVLS